jgi:AMP-binding enzyme C-terminal domain
VDDLTHRVADAERRLASLRTLAELVESEDQCQAFAARITILARQRDTWVKELAGREAAASRPRVREEAILAFQQHVAAEHGSMDTWAGHLMRQLMLILDARVEVWPLRDVQAGTAPDRAVLHLNLPLAGERRAALSRLLREEHVLTAVGAPADVDCADGFKEMIKVKGFGVAPAELESVLLEHPSVRDAAVIGAPDAEAGEVPRAFVALREGETVTADQLIEYVNAKVANYKAIRQLTFVDAIPKTASGKILRRELKAQYGA